MKNSKYFSWLPKDKKLDAFYYGIEEFVDTYIDTKYVKPHYKSKEILDPCVGYIKLNSWEVAILDTALFQRLRKITQLGLAYLVYPTLRYSRFEHTIGVVGRLNQVLQKLREKHDKEENDENKLIDIEEILKQYETQVRLAAIFHDVGHCLFSHLSEDVIDQLEGSDNYPSVKDIRTIFNKKFASGDSNLSIAEIFSICILGTKKVADILQNGNIKIYTTRTGKNVSKAPDLSTYLEQVARLIAGLPVQDDARTIFLAQLISSGLDVDKLDYMSREEWFSGIKIEMDLQRILNKLKLFHISESNKLPQELIKYSKHINNSKSNKNYVVLGIERGGQFSYEEFCVARLALYEKIYLHKKVRAAEAMYKQKLEMLITEQEKFQKAHNWLYLSESLSEINFSKIIHEKTGLENSLFKDIGIPEEKKFSINFMDIQYRKIPFRAFGFGPANSKTDNDMSHDKELGGIDQDHLQLDSVRFWDYLNPKQKFKPDKSSKIEELRLKIVDECIAIISELRKIRDEDDKISEILNNLSINNNIQELDDIKALLLDTTIVDVPDYRRVQLKYGSLNFEEATYQTAKWTLPIDQISRYYQLHRILAYVYTDIRYCPLILLASEKVVYNELGDTKLVFDQTQAVSKEILEISNRVKTHIIENEDSSSFYEGFEDIFPVNNDLQSVSARTKITDIVFKLSKLTCIPAGEEVTYLKVEKFLSQFNKELQLPVLNLISNIEVLANEELYDEIDKIIQGRKNGDKYGILPLGNYMGSSSHMMKSYKNILRQNNIQSLDFNDPDIKKISHLLFVDDNINTGIQALNIIAKMLGCEDKIDEKIQLSEIHREYGEAGVITCKETLQYIKNIPLTFIFITGYEDSDTKLKEYLIKYCGLKSENLNIIIKHRLEQNYKIFSGGSLKDYQDSNNIFRRVKENFIQNSSDIVDLQKAFEDIGKEVVKSRSIIEHYGQEVHQHCLGYQNRESLVVFQGSIPTMTLTALWCNGVFNGKEWNALLPRPKKKAIQSNLDR